MASFAGKIKLVLRHIALFPVYLYRWCISPLLPPSCIYRPTCSAYMVEAVKRHGVIKGTTLGIARIMRCRRGFLGGPDPVPEIYSWQAIKNDYTIYRQHKSTKHCCDENHSEEDSSLTNDSNT